MKKVRFAVVGLGHFAQVAILPAFRSARRAELAALVSDDPKKLRMLGRKYGVPHRVTYDDFDALCTSGEIDAVYLAVPNALHRDFTERAARARVHVLCEKPMATSVADCEAMIAACDAARVKLMIAYRLHFEKANLAAVELARSGRLGEPRFFSSTFSFQVKEENIRVQRATGGGALWDIGVYCVNAARYLFQDEPIEVSCFTASSSDKRFREVEEQASALLRFPRERLAQFTVSFGAHSTSSYELVGSDGVLRVEPAYTYVGELRHTLRVKGRERTRTFPAKDQIAPELEYFADCVLKNQRPEPSGVEGLADVRVIEALHRSAQIGQAVALGGFEKARRPTIKQARRKPPHAEPETVHVEAPHD